MAQRHARLARPLVPLMRPLAIPAALLLLLAWAAPQLAYEARDCRAVCAIEMLER